MNKFENDIIEKSIMTKGNSAEVASLFFQYANNPSCCEGLFDRTLMGDKSSKVNVICAKMFNTYYFLSDFEVSDKGHLMQISSLEDFHIAHLIYSSYLRDTPLLTAYFNDLDITQFKVDLVNYSGFLAESNIYRAMNYFEEVILCSPQTSDRDDQRTIVAHIFQDFLKHDNSCILINEQLFDYEKQRLYFISFSYDNQSYFWIDVLTGTNFHYSHLESIYDGNVKVLFASESKARAFIPDDSSVQVLTPIYNKLKRIV